MAHSEQIKARALAMLLTGDSPRYVAAQLSLPRSTVRRWQREAYVLLREALGPELGGVLQDIRQELSLPRFLGPNPRNL